MRKLYVISGLTGMTGNELARQILEQGDHVIGFDNFFASSLDTISDIQHHPELEFFPYDLRNAEEMNEIEQEVCKLRQEYGTIIYINCAAVVHTEYFYHVDATFSTNTVGMQAFLEQAIRVGAHTYINCSTSEVYSMHSWSEDGVKESDYINLATAEHSQRTSYAVGKLMTEFFLKDAVERGFIRGCSIRFANVYSKNERFAKHIIPHIINSIDTSGKVVLLENAKVTRRTFLHNIDSCSAVLALASTEAALDGSTYNVATDEEISILDLVQLCGSMMGVPHPEVSFSGYRESDPPRRRLNTEKLCAATRWKPQIALRDGIQMCLDHRRTERKRIV